MTREGSINDDGIIFKIMPDGTGFVELLDFTGSAGKQVGEEHQLGRSRVDEQSRNQK